VELEDALAASLQVFVTALAAEELGSPFQCQKTFLQA